MVKRVIVIDDEADWLARLVEVVERAGGTVVGTAESGNKGLTLIAELQPDLILTDLVMRGNDGDGVSIILGTDIPTIILSSDMDERTAASMSVAGDHVTALHKKDVSKITAAIRKALDDESDYEAA